MRSAQQLCAGTLLTQAQMTRGEKSGLALKPRKAMAAAAAQQRMGLAALA